YTETAPVDGESYYCEVKNFCGTVQSKVASLTVRNEVAFTDQPINITIIDGDDAEFTVSVTGFEPIMYQWQEDSGTGFTNILDGGNYSGATSATLNIADVNMPFNGNRFQCLINNVCNNATSNIATLTVNPLIKIFTQPTNLQACLDDAIDFEITGTSAGLDYVWEYNDGRGTWS
ncbi:hypothetical protein, partial [Marinifilum sp. D737]|uniref:hypothetical protein n=1 Tax=Marinifilum sp. D737 TaxID=2969628 RepID=UPI002274397C